MAVTLGTPATAVSGTSASNPATMSLTVGSGGNPLLLVLVSLKTLTVPSVSTVTFGSASLTKLDSIATGTADDPKAELWYLLNPTVSTDTVTVTFSGNVNFCVTSVVAYGVNQITPFGTHAKSSGTGTSSSLTVSSATDELVVDVLARYHTTNAISVGANQTQLSNIVTGRIDTASYNVRQGTSSEVGASSVAMTWSWTTSYKWAGIAVPLKPAFGGRQFQAIFMH